MHLKIPVLNRNFILKSMVVLFALILIPVAICCGYLINSHLARNNYLIYAKGTKDKALLNATWKMTPKEIERANHTTLLPYKEIPFVGDDGYSPDSGYATVDGGRYTASVQKDVNLYNYPAEITYSFFDNMLSIYYVSLEVWQEHRPYDEIIARFTELYGKPAEIKENQQYGLSEFVWDGRKQKVKCWLGKYDDKAGTYHTGIWASYKPFSTEIEKIIKTERRGYF